MLVLYRQVQCIFVFFNCCKTRLVIFKIRQRVCVKLSFKKHNYETVLMFQQEYKNLRNKLQVKWKCMNGICSSNERTIRLRINKIQLIFKQYKKVWKGLPHNWWRSLLEIFQVTSALTFEVILACFNR